MKNNKVKFNNRKIWKTIFLMEAAIIEVLVEGTATRGAPTFTIVKLRSDIHIVSSKIMVFLKFMYFN